MTIGEVKDRQLGQSDKPDYFSCAATTMHIRPENLAYPACPTDGCNKKVIEADGQWRCEKCDKLYPDPEYRFASSFCNSAAYSLHDSYIISMAVADGTEQAWLQGFNDVGNILFGVPANDLIHARVRASKRRVSYRRFIRLTGDGR
jgi:replication factor A1